MIVVTTFTCDTSTKNVQSENQQKSLMPHGTQYKSVWTTLYSFHFAPNLKDFHLFDEKI